MTVSEELRHPSAPLDVRNWMSSAQEWLVTASAPYGGDPSLEGLDEGEKSAIALALSLRADLILIDDRKGARAARAKGLEVVGTLGALNLAIFRVRVQVLNALLKQYSRR